MASRSSCRLRPGFSRWLRGVWLFVLMAIAVVGAGRMALAEWHYARGMSARFVQSSIDHLTAAGEYYAPGFTFRTAQALQLFALSAKLPGIAPAAEASLLAAIDADPSSSELVSKLLAVQRALHHCDGAKLSSDLLVRLAPRSERAKKLAGLPCKPEVQ